MQENVVRKYCYKTQQENVARNRLRKRYCIILLTVMNISLRLSASIFLPLLEGDHNQWTRTLRLYLPTRLLTEIAFKIAYKISSKSCGLRTKTVRTALTLKELTLNFLKYLNRRILLATRVVAVASLWWFRLTCSTLHVFLILTSSTY